MWQVIRPCIAIVLFGNTATFQEYNTGACLRAQSVWIDDRRVFICDGYFIVVPALAVKWVS